MIVSSQKIRNLTKRAAFSTAAFLILAGFSLPAGVYAAAPSDGQQCTPVQPVKNGVSKPTGSAAKTFTYDKCTGLYENAHYIYNPATQRYSAKDKPIYVCNKTTWTWQNTNKWSYVASDSKYVRHTVNADPLAGSVDSSCEKPAPATTSDADLDQSQQPLDTNAQSGSGDPTISSSTKNSASQNDSNNVTLNTNINSAATSGNVSVYGNTVAGNATSGDALASATIINSVNSVTGLNTGGMVTFTKNINGDVNGNIIIDPSALQPADINLNNTSDAKINVKNTGTINNNIDLSAKSGDVSTSRNTEVGDAASGSAKSMANVVNMLNSYIGAGQSFIGTININGNLHGNILMPPKFLTNLQASGAPHTSVTLKKSDNTTINLSSTTDINNQISSLAKSGGVTLARNTVAGSAASGDASTSVEIYNLTGREVTGTNSLLVFVNVMGKWVGVIIGAPAGSHSAQFGNYTSTRNVNFALDSSSQNTINNNINVSAVSGNVESTENTEAGNASSGDAKTAVSVANFSDSTVSLSGWFGILFINVLGNWYGNFGMVPASQPTIDSGPAAKPAPGPKVFKFVPVASSDKPRSNFTTPASSYYSDYGSGLQLTSAKIDTPVSSAGTSSPARQLINSDKFHEKNSSGVSWLIIAGALALAGSLTLLSFGRPKILTEKIK